MATESDFKNIRVYFLAFIAYWGIVLFGYDTGIAGGVVNSPGFQHVFLPGASKSKITHVSQNVVSVLQAGAFFGALGSAPVSSWIGRRTSLVAFSLIFAVGAILQTLAGAGNPARGLSLIYAGRVVAGIGVGAISAVAPAYVSECAPKDVRGRITGLFQIMVAIGVMLSYFINYGISLHIHAGSAIWRIPFGLQLVPCAIMCLGLLVCKESPRWLAQKGRDAEAQRVLAYLRRAPEDSDEVRRELAEIEAGIAEEREARAGLGWREAFTGRGNWPRFTIAIVIFILQQWSGQNTVGYYAPQIFASIGYTSNTSSLLASGIYGIVKVLATTVFVFTGIESLGRVWSLRISAFGMGTLFFIVGAILKEHPTKALPAGAPIPPASQAMAAMLYLYVCFYSLGWGPVPWIYVSDIFGTRTRHYGLSVGSGTQWLFNFMVSQLSLTMETKLVYKLFFLFACINLGGMFVFTFFIPETKGRSLEEMDVLFGAVAADRRASDIKKAEAALDGRDETGSASADEKAPHVA